jgi:hypothetical protein
VLVRFVPVITLAEAVMAAKTPTVVERSWLVEV